MSSFTTASFPALSRDDRVDFASVGSFLRRRWASLVFCLLAWIVGGVTYIVLVTPTYTATSQVLIDPRKLKVFGSDSVNSEPALDSGFVDSQIQVLTSSALLNRIVEKHQLYNDSEFGERARSSLLGMLLSNLVATRTAPIGTSDPISARNARAIDRLRDRLDVQRIGKGNVIAMTVTSESAEKASKLANEIADTFVSTQASERSATAREASDWFADKLEDLRVQVRDSERALADFRTRHNILRANSDGKVSINEQQLAELNIKLAAATLDTAEKQARYEQARRILNNKGRLEELPEAMKFGNIALLRAQQSDLERKDEDLRSTVGPLFPAVLNVRTELQGVQKSLNIELSRLLMSLRHEAEIARSRESLLKQNIQSLSVATGGDSEIGVELRELERTNLANKALFENYLARAKQTQEQAGFEEKEARVISPALTPDRPSNPKIPLVLGVALVMGLVSGLTVATAMELGAQSGGRNEQASTPYHDAIEITDDPMTGERQSNPQAASIAPSLLEPTPPASSALHRGRTSALNEQDSVERQVRTPDVAIGPPATGSDLNRAKINLTTSNSTIEDGTTPRFDSTDDLVKAQPGVVTNAQSVEPQKPKAEVLLRGVLRLPDVKVHQSGLKEITRHRKLERRFEKSSRDLVSTVDRLRFRWGSQTVLVTATDQLQSTHAVSIAIARSAAAAGLKVLLIDADFRERSISRQLNVGDRPGLFEAIFCGAQANALQIAYEDIAVLPAGQPSQTFVQLDIRSRIEELKLTQGRHWIIIDCPQLWIDPLAATGRLSSDDR